MDQPHTTSDADTIMESDNILYTCLLQENQLLRQQIEELQSRETARLRKEEMQDFLIEASKVLASSLDYRQTLANIARSAVPRIADYCLIDMRDPAGHFHRLETVHSDPRYEALLKQLAQLYPPPPDESYGVPAVYCDGQSLLAIEITDASLRIAAKDEEHLALLRQLNPHSAIMVPLIVQQHVRGVITLGMNVSQRHYDAADLELAEELARHAAQAIENARLHQATEEALQMRDTFLSIASHELRTPITSLLGFAELLERRAKREGWPEHSMRALGVLSSQAHRLKTLTDIFLDISRLTQGKIQFEQLPIDLVEVVRSLVNEVRESMECHEITLMYPIHPLIVLGDPVRLAQIFQNLLDNAIKYSPSGGSIRIVIERTVDIAQVSIIDQGIGIPAAGQARLFERFYRAENTAEISGMGIGLYLVQEFVNLHRGTVSVCSSEGRGSTFTIQLPLHNPDCWHTAC